MTDDQKIKALETENAGPICWCGETDPYKQAECGQKGCGLPEEGSIPDQIWTFSWHRYETKLEGNAQVPYHSQAALDAAVAEARRVALEEAAVVLREACWPEDGTYGPDEKAIQDAERGTVEFGVDAIRALTHGGE